LKIEGFRIVIESPSPGQPQTVIPGTTSVWVAKDPPAGMPERMAADCGLGVSLALTRIPAGSFMMGSPPGEGRDNEKPQRHVTISQPFFMGIFPVTQEQFEAVMGVNPSHFKGQPDSLRRPVENVSWNDAVEFCRKLTNKSGMDVRLPTEAEWEYACRAGVSMPYHTGANLSLKQANYQYSDTQRINDQWVRIDKRQTTPINTYKANLWELQDMHGNVLEWCSDWSSNYTAEPSIDPKGPSEGQQRRLRGGSWENDSDWSRSAHRRAWEPGNRDNATGFRVVITPNNRR